MRIAAVQHDIVWEDREATFAHLGRHLVRFAFCKGDEVLGEAVERLRRMA